ncbi:MAG: acyltransferase [Lachnospiraceae bacterium]|nr:acyltransferase [Lachnospiraceae bacterium]
MKKRVRFYDLIRIICFCNIIYYHMTVQLAVDNICGYGIIDRFHSSPNMHIATMSVAVFFILSGASLGLTTREHFSIGKYYKKRLLRLLVPFYIATVFCITAVLVLGISIGSFNPAVTPKWTIIFTVLGLDTWMTMHGLQTFSIGLGEWFLGALIVLSVLYPLFRGLIRKIPGIFLGIVGVVYVGTILLYQQGFFDIVPMHMNLLLKGSEFILGIYFGMYREKLSPRWSILTIPVCLLFFVCPIALPISEAVKITVVAVCFFLSFACLENLLQRRDHPVMDRLCGCSYELFLCHHMVIYLVSVVLEKFLTGIPLVIGMFIAELIGMAIVTIVLKFLSDRLVNLLLGVK